MYLESSSLVIRISYSSSSIFISICWSCIVAYNSFVWIKVLLISFVIYSFSSVC